MPTDADVLRAAYEAFNARDVETGELQADTHVLHRYRLEDSLVVWMGALEDPA